MDSREIKRRKLAGQARRRKIKFSRRKYPRHTPTTPRFRHLHEQGVPDLQDEVLTDTNGEGHSSDSELTDHYQAANAVTDELVDDQTYESGLTDSQVSDWDHGQARPMSRPPTSSAIGLPLVWHDSDPQGGRHSPGQQVQRSSDKDVDVDDDDDDDDDDEGGRVRLLVNEQAYYNEQELTGGQDRDGDYYLCQAQF